MSDIFLKNDVIDLLKGKSVLFAGDSILRNVYKDLVWLVSTDRSLLVPYSAMKRKGEKHFCQDKLIVASSLTKGRDYEEMRDFYSKEHELQLSFFFLTRVFNDGFKDLLKNYINDFGSWPDLMVLSSALWDITRWGPDGPQKFRNDIYDLMSFLRDSLKDTTTQVVWMTTPPISNNVRGGVIVKQLEFQLASMPTLIMECNQYAAKTVAAFGFDVLDMHHQMAMQIHRRSNDGIHWNPDAVRMQTNVLLTHFCLSRDIALPNRWAKFYPGKKNVLLDEAKRLANVAASDVTPFPLPERPTTPEKRTMKKAKRRLDNDTEEAGSHK